MDTTYAEYPPTLAIEGRRYLTVNLNDWAAANGLCIRPAPASVEDSDGSGVSAQAVTAPVTLFPSLFPRHCFEQARNACLAYNELYSAIASDEAWLKPVIEELIAVDDFIDGLWKIHVEVEKEGYAQTLQLGLFRSDYMIHMESGSLDAKSSVKQVEFNTIASSFGGLSTKVSQLHRHLHDIGAYPQEAAALMSTGSLPESSSIADLAAGLAKAYQAYGSSKTNRTTCVVFVVQDAESNVFDQRHLEYELNSTHNIKTFRLPWTRVLDHTSTDSDKTLLYHPPHDSAAAYEVSTVYFRAGYSPTEYNTPTAWEARLSLERSRAIKCPSVLLQLAGTKKVQQVLATPHSPHLAHFISDAAAAASIESTFAPIYPLDESPAGLEARKIAQDPARAASYVLKPQREGGGNNVYREAIPEHLKTLPQSSWPANILMEMIEPPPQRNVIARNGVQQAGNVICELGIYGVCLWDESEGVGRGTRKVLENFEAGYLLRTKGASSSEGGVAAGFGSVDSVLLVDV